MGVCMPRFRKLTAGLIAVALATVFCEIIQANAQPTPAQFAPKRVALIIGQNAYTGGGWPALANPRRDAERLAGLLAANGIEVHACDGKTPGCFDLDETALAKAVTDFRQKAQGAGLALVFFAGHGGDGGQGNVLAPVNSSIDCQQRSIARGILVERFIEATKDARHKLVILDACRNDAVAKACPGQAVGKATSFREIKPAGIGDLIVMSSTQFGAEALDGPAGGHSPFMTALIAALEQHPRIYFEQVLNDVATRTHEAALAQSFKQLPGRAVGGAAPQACLAGTDCVGDPNMLAMATDITRLAAEAQAARQDAAGVQALIAQDEARLGRRLTPEERQAAVKRYAETLTSLAGSSEPKVKQAGQLITAGKVAEGQAKLDEALDDDDKAAAALERLAAEKRKSQARTARDAARLALGSDVVKALGYFKRATTNDPADARTWLDYAWAAVAAGRTDEAKAAYEQAAQRARDAGDAAIQFWGNTGLGDMARAQGHLPSARRLYDTALAVIAPLAQRDPNNSEWQRDLSVSHDRIGDVLRQGGDGSAALAAYRAGLAISEGLAKRDPNNSEWQRDLSVSHSKTGDVLRQGGDGPAALAAYRAGLAISEGLAKRDPNNSEWQRDLSVSHDRIGDVLRQGGDGPAARAAYQAGLAIREGLAKRDPNNSEWQRDLSFSLTMLGNMAAERKDTAEARTYLARALAIDERLAARDRGNVGWQIDVAVSNMDMLRFAEDADTKRRHLEAAAAVLHALKAKGRLPGDRADFLARIERDLAALEK